MQKVLLVFSLIITVSLNFFSINFYFGNLHSHTELSDGIGTPFDAYTYAKTVAKIDFLAITDHAYYFEQPLSNGENKFEFLKRISNEFTDSNFLALAGFEWTETGSGHINVYNTQKWIDRNSTDLESFYKWLAKNKAIAQFNHPIYKFGDNFNEFEYYPEADKYINLIEVGNGSWGDNINPEMEKAFRIALSRGWHLGATVGQDNHKGKWGNINDSRTVVLADHLTKKDFFDALRKRHVYASEDKNIRVLFGADNHLLGDIIYDATSVNLYAWFEDPDESDKIEKLYIISNDGTKISREINSKSFEGSFKFKINTAYEWYYLKLVQKDGQEVITSPIWVQSSTKVYLFDPIVNPKDIRKGDRSRIFFNIANLSNEEKEVIIQLYIENQLQATKSIVLDGMAVKRIVLPFEAVEEDQNTIKILLKFPNGKIDSYNYAFEALPGNFPSILVYRGNTFEEFSKLHDYLQRSSIVRFEDRILRSSALSNINMLIISMPSEIKIGTGGLSKRDIKLLKGFLNSGGNLLMLCNHIEGSESKIRGVFKSFNDFFEEVGLKARVTNTRIPDGVYKTTFGIVKIKNSCKLKNFDTDAYTISFGNETFGIIKGIGNGKIILISSNIFADDLLEGNKEFLNKLFEALF